MSTIFTYKFTGIDIFPLRIYEDGSARSGIWQFMGSGLFRINSLGGEPKGLAQSLTIAFFIITHTLYADTNTEKIRVPIGIGKPTLNADNKTYSVAIKWAGAKDAKTWLYVHKTKTTGSKHDASNNSYTYPNLGGGYTFDLYVQSKDGNIIKKTFKTKKISDGNTGGGTTRPIIEKTINFKEYKSLNNSRITKNEKGLYLSDEVQSNVDNARATNPDIVYSVTTGKKGFYTIETTSYLNKNGEKAFGGKTDKYDSLFMKIKIGKDSVKRVIYVPWALDKKIYKSKLGNFYLDGSIQDINIWLPQGVILNKIVIKKYIPPVVPEAARSYEPSIIPETRPRLWVNASSIDTVKSNLEDGKNKAIWTKVKKIAIKPYHFPYSANQKITKANKTLEETMRSKAFYYLIEQNRTVGREAIDIAKKYIEHIDFGNILDVSRDLGSVIYNVSLVYDWCYDLLKEDEKKLFITKFESLARDMQIGWPPFKQAVTYGHGNEAQLLKDLLSMSIAIYDEDPTPYKYTSYRVFKELTPMKRFEYQSPRHSQGTSYGGYRPKYDLMAALLLKKMSDKDVFDKNILDVYKSLWYLRLTNKSVFNDGDNRSQNLTSNLYYGILSLLHTAYSNDYDKNLAKFSQSDMALTKEKIFEDDTVLTLLLNDPKTKGKVLTKDEISVLLPLTSFTGKVTGSMIARTGWDFSDGTNDVVVDIKGGGYSFGNHQHADAGSFQISYKGKQIVDLGQYHYYGTPYDRKFNKRSIAHSMMLVVDPTEYTSKECVDDPRKCIRDGGQKKALRKPPKSEKEIKDNLQKYKRGEVISESTAPENVFAPDFSYYALDLASAYSKKISTYRKKSVFINLKDKDIPAVLIMLDTIQTSDETFKKYWQINTLNKPTIDSSTGIITTHNSIKRGDEGNVVVNMLKPSVDERKTTLFSEGNSTNVFGTQYTPPRPDMPEANGTRIMISPLGDNDYDEFLTAFTMKKPDIDPDKLPISYTEASDKKTLHVSVGDNSVGNNILVVMNKTDSNLKSTIDIHIANNNTKLFVSGLQEGKWTLRTIKSVTVKKGKNTAYFENLSAGDYTLEYNE